MRILLVLCDTRGDGESTARLRQAIEEYGESFSLSETSYLLYTDRSSDAVFENLRHHAGPESKESLLVLSLPEPYTGRAPTKVRLWMERLREGEKASTNQRPSAKSRPTDR